ncbi:MAG: ECs_2282 family putative zinc-binding protein [Achromobacter sp.]|uniref:ECs_2282 family putative zinc-binding protein n=1 Tax=Achromobacter sp. TaxID=134375 RepID=UPI003D01694A
MGDTITLSCAKCGSNEFDYPGGVQANLKTSDTITCKGCGASGTYGSAIESAKKQVMDQIKGSFGKLFK